MAPPRVTIAVPVYNGERYLRETLDSIANQTYDDWEAVVVDDASSDRSLELVSAFARCHSGRVRVLALERNVGVAEARNTAIRASSGGELVALLDQDDCWREDYLARTVKLFDEALAAGRRPGIVACDAWIETGDGQYETFSERFWWRDEIDYDGMIERCYILARAVFSRAAFDAVGGFAPECLTSDDYDLWLRLMEAGYEVITTREPLVVYRIHADAQSCDEQLAADGILVSYRRALERGAMSARQRRAVRSRIRHYRALRERAAVRAAVSEHRALRACVLAVRAAPYGLAALLQDPRRWGEWAHSLLGADFHRRPRTRRS